MKRIILDTNAYAHLFKESPFVLNALNRADEVYMSVIVLGELYTGFYGGSKFDKNVRDLDEFLSDPAVHIIEIKEDTSEIFGKLKHELTVKGTPVPINDIWIAAQCIEIGSILVTFDSHFDNFPQVRLWENSGKKNGKL
jgi:tRNA(fMet)-specific endonuclease VapC